MNDNGDDNWNSRNVSFLLQGYKSEGKSFVHSIRQVCNPIKFNYNFFFMGAKLFPNIT